MSQTNIRWWFYPLLLLIPGAVIGAAFYAAWPILSICMDHSSLIQTPKIDTTQLLVNQKQCLWGNRPNHSQTMQSSQDGTTYHVTTNSLGMRGPEIGEKAGRLRILALGDSTTFGLGVDDQETWPAALQKILDPAADTVQVLNGGCIAYTVFQSRAYLESFALAYGPDVVVVTAGHNDPTNWNLYSDPETWANINYPDDAERYFKLRQKLFPFDPDRDYRPRLAPGEFVDALLEFNAFCKNKGILCIFLLSPWRAEVFPGKDRWPSYHPLMRFAAEHATIPLVDPIEALQGAGAQTFLPNDDVHFSAQGNALVAEAIRQTIQSALAQGQCQDWQQRLFTSANDQLGAGNTQKASLLLEKLSRLAPRAAYLEACGNAALIQGDPFSALAAWQEGMRIDPEYWPLFKCADDVLSTLGLDESVCYWQNLAQSIPDSFPVWNRLGDRCFELGQFALAAAAFENAVDIAPNNPYTRIGLGKSLMALGDGEAGRLELKAALALRPDDAALADVCNEWLLRDQ